MLYPLGGADYHNLLSDHNSIDNFLIFGTHNLALAKIFNFFRSTQLGLPVKYFFWTWSHLSEFSPHPPSPTHSHNMRPQEA